MTYNRFIIRALFALDRVLGPFGLVLVTTLDGEPGEGFKITRIRLARRSSFLPE